MITKTFLTLMLLFNSTLLLANVDQLKGLLFEQACLQRLGTYVNSYKQIQKNHFRKESKNSIFSLFNALTESHSKHFDYILEFKEKNYKSGMSADEAVKITDKLIGMQTEYLTKAMDVSRKDQTFLEIINTLEIEVYKLGEKVKMFARGCPSSTTGLASSISKDVGEWKKSLAEMRSYVVAAARKRTTLFSIVFEVVKMELKKIVQTDSLAKLSKKRGQISAILEGGKLQNEIMRWFYNLAKNGFCDDMVFKYIQYEKPLKCLRIHYEQALEYDAQIDALGLSVGLAAMLKSQLKAYKDSIKETLDELETKGYQGVLSEQKFFVNAYSEIAHTLSQSCRDTIAQYQGKSKNVASLAQFRDVEPLYIKVVDSCVVVK